MKRNFPRTAALFCAGVTLLFGSTAVRADDEVKTSRRQQRHEVVQTTEIARKRLTAIPTRDDRGSQQTKGHVVGGANGPEYRVRTGTALPEHYNRRGYSTDSRDNEFIYDKNDIRLQSKNNVGDSLRNVPGVTVRGLR